MPESFAIVQSLISMFSSVFSLLTYVAISYGLYSIAQACGIRNPWLAWIPFGRDYILGSVADHQTERNESRTTKYRKRLLALNIVTTVLAVILCIALIVVVVIALMNSGSTLETDPDLLADNILSNSLVLVVVGLMLSAAAIAYSVFFYIAIYKVYQLVDPKNAVLYIVLTILIGIASPIIFFIIAKKHPVYVNEENTTFYVDSTGDTNQNNTYSI